MIYFISDLHLGHADILKYDILRTHFKDIKEHDAHLIKLISSLHENDTIYILGDLGNKECLHFLRNVKCKTVLIMGNHDRYAKEFYAEIFDEVYDAPIYVKKRIVVSHCPIPVTDGVLNIHGHLHSGRIDKPNYLNCNVKLVSLRQAENIVGTLPKDSIKFLHEWWIDMQVCENFRGDLVLREDGTIDSKKSISKREMMACDSFEISTK